MKFRHRITFSLLALWVAANLTPSAALAQSDVKADSATDRDDVLVVKKLVDEAMSLYAKADWDKAREVLLKAYAVRPHRAILANLADVELKMERYLDAARHLQKLIADLPPEPHRRVEIAEAQLAECRQQLGSLHVTVSVSGATVSLNGKPIGTSPLSDEVFVEPGDVHIDAEHPDYLMLSRDIGITKGETQDVVLNLAPRLKPTASVPVAVAAPAPAEQPASSLRTRNIVVISGAALSIAGATVGIILWTDRTHTLSQADSLRQSLAVGAATTNFCGGSNVKDPTGCSELHNLYVRSDRQTNFAVASFVGAGVVAVGTSLTYLLWPTKKHSASTDKASHASIIVEPWSSREANGLQVLGTF